MITFWINGAPTSKIAYQITIWTNSGVFRKISTYSVAIRATSQLEDSRATPMTTPTTNASIMATMTARSVDHTPTRYMVKRELVTPSTSMSH